MAKPICFRLLEQLMRLAASRTFCTAGNRSPMRTAMIAMTTNSSMRVKARRREIGMIASPRKDWAPTQAEHERTDNLLEYCAIEWMRSQRNLAGKNFRSVDNVCPLAAQDEADAKNQAAAYLL